MMAPHIESIVPHKLCSIKIPGAQIHIPAAMTPAAITELITLKIIMKFLTAKQRPAIANVISDRICKEGSNSKKNY